MWITVVAVIRKGIRKWSEKKRERVGESTAKPPHSHVTIVEPK